MLLLQALPIFAACQALSAFTPKQTPLRSAGLKLHGRFLHITDIHPDPYYLTNASVASSCHRIAPKTDLERAGYWSTPWTECDTSIRLMNFTFDYLAENWADQIDFVIWTGDNARHDNDNKIPRTTTEIYQLNRAVAARMQDTFSSRGIPVVPSLGNNDVWPHNILTAGPNPTTHTYAEIWQSFIPFPSYQVFQRGAYYSVEVIPNKVAAISLNTMYFYDSNKAVGGCQYKVTDDPGNLQFDWLDVQLNIFRDRGIQVYLTGHVPPSPWNYFPECFRRYVEVSLRYQDTIIGHLYGHMNKDHFLYLNHQDLLEPPVTAQVSKFSLHKVLLEDFTRLPKKSKTNEDEYTFVTVSPSAVDNPYLSSLRIFSYNITSPDDATVSKKKRRRGRRRGKKKDCKKKKNHDTWACRPQKPRHSDANSPSRSNTIWTPLGYAQFYLPDVATANSTHKPTWNLEYLTYRLSALHPHPNATEAESASFAYPVPVHLLPPELRNVTGVQKSSFAPYDMDDLTIGSYLKLARKLVKKKKLWARFKRFMYLRG